MNLDRILFLDFDGVLNSIAFMRRAGTGGLWPIDKESIPHLQRIVDATDCSIVISSSWRIGRQLGELRRLLLLAGFRSTAHVIGRTPLSDTGRQRGHEVQEWLDLHVGELVAERYVCLDDGSDFLIHQPLVQTNIEVGLQPADADRCIAILMGG